MAVGSGDNGEGAISHILPEYSIWTLVYVEHYLNTGTDNALYQYHDFLPIITSKVSTKASPNSLRLR